MNNQDLQPWQGQQFVGVNGSPLVIRGWKQVEVNLLQGSFQHKVLVADSLMSGGILGLDFLQEHGCVVDLSNRVLDIASRGIKIPRETAHRSGGSVTVELINSVTIPPRSELEVLAKTRVHVNGGTWLLEGKDHPAFVARAVVSPRCDSVVVRLLNPHDEGVTVHKKATIAELNELDTVAIVSALTPTEQPKQGLSEEKQQLLWEMVKNCEGELTADQQEEFFELLLSYADAFAESGSDLGRTGKIQHTIHTGEAQPVRQGVRRIPPARKEEVSKLVREMLDKDIISRSSSPWAAPIVLVQKEGRKL